MMLIAASNAGLAEQIGTVSLTLDGETEEWFTASGKVGDNTAYTVSFTPSNRLSKLNIQAHPEPKISAKDFMAISVSYFGEYEAGKSPMNVEVLYLPEGMSNPFYTSAGLPTKPTVEVEAMEFDEGFGQIIGTFGATVCKVQGLYEDPNTDDCIEISGRFDSQIKLN